MMLKIFALALAAGCVTTNQAPPDELTRGDAVEIVAASTCDRAMKCGWAVTPTCVEDTKAELCAHDDCGAPYTLSEMESLIGCVEQYAQLACITTVSPPACSP